MSWKVWSAAAAAFGISACTAQATPPVALSAPGPAAAQVQYWGGPDPYWGGYEVEERYVPPRRYERPYGYYDRPYRYERHRYGYHEPRRWERPYGYYNREAAKETMQDYRRAQKEQFKDRVRAWNRAHGF